MTTSTVTARGQTTIPVDIRQKMLLQEGDRIEWIERDDGHIEIIPVTVDASKVAGMFSEWVKKPITVDEMNAKVKEAAVKKFNQGLI